ncbi:MAG: D-alanine--D-alanine ligase [Kiritimatiellia bacterium]
MSEKIIVVVLFGGCSVEHEISLLSAKNIINALRPTRYDVVLVGIDKQGGWHLYEKNRFLVNDHDPHSIRLATPGPQVTLLCDGDRTLLFDVGKGRTISAVDVVFPVLHGTRGEDGTIQGLLELAGVAYVGAGVLGSAIGMDKEVTKRLLREAEIPVADFFVLRDFEACGVSFHSVAKRLGLPFFVKPAGLGSSVAVSKVSEPGQFRKAMAQVFQYDTKVILEQYVRGREIECSVLGNEKPMASLPGEVVPHHDFYSYEAKYLDENGATLIIPARLPQRVVKKAQETAVRAFRALCCEGMARVDMFLEADTEIFVNEINTIPGFTKISMYPKLWEASGLSCAQLVDRLVSLALARHRKIRRLKRSVRPEELQARR